MRVLIHTFIVSLLFVLGIALFWCPAQAVFSFTPVNWAVLYEKAHPAATKNQYSMGIPSAMHYPFRMAATGFMAGALILGFLRPKSLGPVMASTPGKGARVFLFILALGFVGTALPWVYGFTKSTLYGISVLGGFVFILGGIGAFLFGRETVLTHRLLQGDGLVAHWTYTDKEWQAFTQWAVQEEKNRG